MPPTKLRAKRVSQACDFCHRRGLKCKTDSNPTSTPTERTFCLTCVEYGQECTRERRPKKRGTKPRAVNSPARKGTPDAVTTSTQQPPLTAIAGRPASALANRRTMTLLLDVYLDSIHPNFPVFCERELWVGWRDGTFPQDNSDYMSLMCLCALSAQHVGDGALFNEDDNVNTVEWTNLRSDYIAEAMHLVPINFESSDLNLVRSYALLTLLGAQTGDNAMLHRFLGLCHGVCAQLNLHDESRWPRTIGECETEVRRRLWWSIYRLEVHTACVLGNIVRTPERRCGVGYPVGAHHPAFIPGRNGQYEDWFDGWNTTTDLYRVLEHAISDLRAKNRPRHQQSILGPQIVGSDSTTIMMRLAQIQEHLLPQFVTPASRSDDSGRNRCGFQTPNIICTIHLARLLSCIAGENDPLLACSLAGDLVKNIMAIPVEYMRATGSPLIQQLAGVGHILVGIAKKNGLQEIHFIKIKHVIQSIVGLVELLVGQSAIAGSIRERLTCLLAELEELYAASPKPAATAETLILNESVQWFPHGSLFDLGAMDGRGLFLNNLLTDFTWLYPTSP